MKKLLLGLVLALTINTTYAHTITQSCNYQGKVKFTCSDFSDHGHDWVKIHITGLWGNGTSDTLFKIAPSYAFDVYIPQPNPNVAVTVTFTNTNTSGVIIGETHTVVTNNCIVTALKFGYFNVFPYDNMHAKVELTVFDVENVTNININVLSEGKVRTIGVILPDNIKENKTYSLILKYR